MVDPNTVIDHATYEEPTKPSEGFRHVLLNGMVALEEGRADRCQGAQGRAAEPAHAESSDDARQSRTECLRPELDRNGSSLDVSFAVAQRPVIILRAAISRSWTGAPAPYGWRIGWA